MGGQMIVATLLSAVGFGIAAGAFRSDVRRAIACANYSEKQIAAERGIAAPVLSRKLNGERPITDAMLEAMPDSVLAWLAVLLVERVGLPAEVRVGVRMARQLKMGLGDEAESTKAVAR